MLDLLKFNQDFSYKYLAVYPNYLNKNNEDKINITLTLWKTNNRLSYLRCWLFLEKFFNGIKIKHIAIKPRIKKTYHYLRFSFEFHANWHIFYLLQHKLPEPEIRIIAAQFILTYNFYRFVLEMPIKLDDQYSLQKIKQILPKKWQNF